MTKPIARLSLDLDNMWCYLRTHGVAGWDKYPSYLNTVVPRVLDVCAVCDLQLIPGMLDKIGE
jgi:peptidoglycan-N-acetylglucosamine deacetylase